MKMSYRDRVILLVVIIIALVLCGIFLIVKPTTTKISTNKASLATAQAEVDRINGIIEQIPVLGETIESEYNESKSYAENFAEGRDPYEADQFIQEYLNSNSIEVSSFSVNEPTTEEISFYSYSPNVITYPLLEAADLNGDIAAETAEKLKTSTVFADLESQTVESYSVDIQFKGKKENILALLDSVKDIDENILINSVSIADYTFNADATDSSEKGYSTGSMNVTFYVLEPLAEPVLG
jgi:hypothetical protein